MGASRQQPLHGQLGGSLKIVLRRQVHRESQLIRRHLDRIDEGVDNAVLRQTGGLHFQEAPIIKKLTQLPQQQGTLA